MYCCGCYWPSTPPVAVCQRRHDCRIGAGRRCAARGCGCERRGSSARGGTTRQSRWCARCHNQNVRRRVPWTAAGIAAPPPPYAAEQHGTTTTMTTLTIPPVPIGEAHDERASWPPTPTAAARSSAKTWDTGFYIMCVIMGQVRISYVSMCNVLVFVGIEKKISPSWIRRYRVANG